MTKIIAKTFRLTMVSSITNFVKVTLLANTREESPRIMIHYRKVKTSILLNTIFVAQHYTNVNTT
jgi:hypothetical protein